MKRLKNLILVALVFFVGLGFTACKNNNSGNGGNQNQQKQSYTITYQDTKGLTNENPTIYTEDTETIILKDLENTDDYEFLGWYNGEAKVTKITKGSKGNLTLTAKWKEIIRELAYKLGEDGTYYIVTGMGECNVPNIVIPDTYNGLPVKEIGKRAFENDITIISVVIGNNVTSIGEDAFYSYRLLSVTIGKNVTKIGGYAFYGCWNLVEIYNLSSLNIKKGSSDYGYVGDYAKDIYTSLDEPSKLKTSNGMIYYVNDDEKIAIISVELMPTSVIIEEDCTEINYEAFHYNNWLTEIYNLSSIDIAENIKNGEFQYIFDYDESDFYIYTSLDEPSKLKTSNGMIYYITDKEKIAIRPETIKLDLENNCFVFDKEVIVIDDDCTRIGKYAFYGGNLTNIEIPDSVTSIGNYAFEGCSNLTNIEIPDSVTSIGGSAFEECSSLTSITIGNSVASIGDYAFHVNYNPGFVINFILTSVYYTGTIENWCNISFSDYYSNPMYYASHFYIKNSNGEYEELTEIEISSSIIEIKDYTFYGFNNVTKVTIPNSVTNIGSSAFSGYSSLTSVYYTGTIENWCNITFIRFDSNPMYYASHFYIKNSNGEYEELTEIEIPNTVTKINDYAFYEFNNVTKVTISNSVTSIGEDAFYGCNRLVEIYNLSSLNIEKGSSDYGYIGYYTIDIYTSLDEPSKLKVSNGVIYYINGTEKIAVAPEDMNVTNIILDNDCTEINQYLFYNCSNLEKVYYNGTSSEWDKTSIDIYYSYLTSATRYYYSETKPIESGNYWYYDTSGNIVEW